VTEEELTSKTQKEKYGNRGGILQNWHFTSNGERKTTVDITKEQGKQQQTDTHTI